MIDDSPQNIEGALTIGMPGVIFHGNTSALRASLKELGVSLS
jgi:FMN phosphatase YigB (HAD superfamily)